MGSLRPDPSPITLGIHKLPSGSFPKNCLKKWADAIAFAGHKTLYSTFGIAGVVLGKDVDLDVFLAGGNGIKSMDLIMPDTAEEIDLLLEAVRKMDLVKLKGLKIRWENC